MNTAVITQMLPGACGSVVLFWILVRIEPLYAAVLAVVAPLLFVLSRAAERHAWFRQENVRMAWETFSRGARFMIQAHDLTRSHAAEEFEIARQTRNVQKLRDISLELNRFDAAQQVLRRAAAKLALARALLRQPDFLIFDEPTNHLDEEAIALLLHNLAHDPIALRHASRAWRLENGILNEAATLETGA